jgi:hypothetical protein
MLAFKIEIAKFIRILFFLGHCLPAKFHLLPRRPVCYSSLGMYLFALYLRSLFRFTNSVTLSFSVLKKVFLLWHPSTDIVAKLQGSQSSALLNSSTSAPISYLQNIFLTKSKKITHLQTKSQLHLDWIFTLSWQLHVISLIRLHLLEKMHPKIRKCEAASILPEF